MADKKDELEARRWFRQRLAQIGEQYPELKDPAHQQRLTEALEEGEHVMPRTPTGRPRGRPPGSGQLGEEGVDHIRLTVRLPKELYDALEAVTYTREAPDLARTVRSALEHYLTCPHRRQTENVLLGGIRGQTANGPEPGRATEAPRNEKRQTANVPALAGYESGETAIPQYDPTRYYLGKLCPAQHDHDGSGQSLRRWHNQSCRECERLGKREARAKRTKRQATA